MLTATVVAAYALAGCGGSDDPSSTPTALTTPTAADASPTATAGKKKHDKKGHGKQHQGKADPGKTATPAVESPTATSTRGIPQTTPTPGPALPFTVTITADAVTSNLASIPAGKELKVTLKSEVKKAIGINLLSNTVPVGVARIAPPETQIFVLVRNLDPGKLVIKSGKFHTTVKVVAGG